MTPPGAGTPDGSQRSRPERSGRLTVLAIVLFALAFAVGGFLAVKAITAGRGPGGVRDPAPGAPAEGGAKEASPGG